MKFKSLLLAMFLCSTSCFADNLTTYFDSLAKQEKVEYKKIGSMMLKLSRAFMPGLAFESVEIIKLGKCNGATKNKIIEEIQTLKDPDFESVVKTDDKGKRIKIFYKIKGKIIEEMVSLSLEDKKEALVRIRGKIKPEQLDKITKHPSK